MTKELLYSLRGEERARVLALRTRMRKRRKAFLAKGKDTLLERIKAILGKEAR